MDMQRSRRSPELPFSLPDAGLPEFSEEALIKSPLPQSLWRMYTDLPQNLLLRSANPVRFYGILLLKAQRGNTFSVLEKL